MTTSEWERTLPRVLVARLARRAELDDARAQVKVRLAAAIIAEIRNTLRTKETDTYWTPDLVLGSNKLPPREMVRAQHAALRAGLRRMFDERKN